jgi:hypothetical protein
MEGEEAAGSLVRKSRPLSDIAYLEFGGRALVNLYNVMYTSSTQCLRYSSCTSPGEIKGCHGGRTRI